LFFGTAKKNLEWPLFPPFSLAHLVPPDVPVILETVVPEDQIEGQLRLAQEALRSPTAASLVVGRQAGLADRS
jgi:hypothetical protein